MTPLVIIICVIALVGMCLVALNSVMWYVVLSLTTRCDLCGRSTGREMSGICTSPCTTPIESWSPSSDDASTESHIASQYHQLDTLAEAYIPIWQETLAAG